MNDLVIYGVLITIIALLIMMLIFQRSVMKLRIAMINSQVQLLEKHLARVQNDNNRISEERDIYFQKVNSDQSKLEALENIEKRIINILEPIKEQLARLNGKLS